MPTINIRVSTPELVDYICECLADTYFYDEDYSALYGAGWQITGIQLMGPHAHKISMIVALILASKHETNAKPVSKIFAWSAEADALMAVWFTGPSPSADIYTEAVS